MLPLSVLPQSVLPQSVLPQSVLPQRECCCYTLSLDGDIEDAVGSCKACTGEGLTENSKQPAAIKVVLHIALSQVSDLPGGHALGCFLRS